MHYFPTPMIPFVQGDHRHNPINSVKKIKKLCKKPLEDHDLGSVHRNKQTPIKITMNHTHTHTVETEFITQIITPIGSLRTSD